jgi:Tfp pilus assembly protein PilF
MNRIGYQLLNSGRTLEALEVFKKNASNYPKSANVYDSLGEAFEKNGQKEKAADNYRKAVGLAAAAGDTRLESTYRKHLERVEKK